MAYLDIAQYQSRNQQLQRRRRFLQAIVQPRQPVFQRRQRLLPMTQRLIPHIRIFPPIEILQSTDRKQTLHDRIRVFEGELGELSHERVACVVVGGEAVGGAGFVMGEEHLADGILEDERGGWGLEGEEGAG
jgi:hypothetical protein